MANRALFSNNASTTVSGSLSQGGTTVILASGSGAEFPSPSGTDYFLMTLFEKDESANEENIEVVKCTARTADTLTIVRDYENMTGNAGGYAYPTVGGRTVYVELRLTAAGTGTFLQGAANLGDLSDVPTARTNLGLGDSAVLDVGTAVGTVAAGDHTHTGVYEPAITTLGVSKGGTGVGTLTGLVKGNGTSAFSAATVRTDYAEPTTALATGILKNTTTTGAHTIAAAGTDYAKPDTASSWTAQQTFKEVKDTVHTITDAASFEIDPANGSVQVVTLGASRTPLATNFEAGQTVLLGIDDGSAYSVTWTSSTFGTNGTGDTNGVRWVKSGGTGAAPTLATTGFTWVLLWKQGAQVFGAIVGSN